MLTVRYLFWKEYHVRLEWLVKYSYRPIIVDALKNAILYVPIETFMKAVSMTVFVFSCFDE